jgi:hypothetical protein
MIGRKNPFHIPVKCRMPKATKAGFDTGTMPKFMKSNFLTKGGSTATTATSAVLA